MESMVIPSEYISALHPSIIAVSSISSSISHYNFFSSGAIKNGDPILVSSSISESFEGNLEASPKSNNLI